MAVDKSTGSLFTTQVIPFGSQSNGGAGDARGSHSQVAPTENDKSVDVARQRRRVTARGDPFPDGNDPEQAGGASPVQRFAGSACSGGAGEAGAEPRSSGLPAVHSRRDYSRPIAELILYRYSVTLALERLCEAAGCRDRGELARWFRASEQDVDQAESRGVIPAEWLLDLFLLKGVNPNWVLTGRGSRHLASASAPAPLAERDLAEACLSTRIAARHS